MDYAPYDSLQHYAGFEPPKVEASDPRQSLISKRSMKQRIEAARERYRRIPKDETDHLVPHPKPVRKTKPAKDAMLPRTKSDHQWTGSEKHIRRNLKPEKKLLYRQNRKERHLRNQEILLQATKQGADPTVVAEAEKIRAKQQSYSDYQKSYRARMTGEQKKFYRKTAAQRKMKKLEMAKESEAANEDNDDEEYADEE